MYNVVFQSFQTVNSIQCCFVLLSGGQVRNFGVVFGVLELPLVGSEIPAANIISASTITIPSAYSDSTLSSDVAVISK